MRGRREGTYDEVSVEKLDVDAFWLEFLREGVGPGREELFAG